jgi:predicted oxidoreductase
MFDQNPSLPMRAAIASLLGSCFGIAMILFSHGAQAQAVAAVEGHGLAAESRSAASRVADAALAAVRGPDTTLGAGLAGTRGLRLHDSASEPVVGLRLQSLPRRTLGGDGAGARSGSDPLTLGVQVRF